MHLLVGALVGALLGVVGALIIAKVTGKPITWKTVVAGAVGGAVGGLITAATFGAGGAVAAPAARTATAYVVGGAGNGAAGRFTANVLEGRPAEEGVATATAVGATTGLAFYGAGRALAPVLDRVAAALPFRLPGSAPPEPPPPKLPEWETYPWKTPPPAKPGDIIRVKIADLRSRQATIEFRNGRYSETEYFDPKTETASTDPAKGQPMIPEVSWVDWLDGEEPFWAVREGNHRTFDAWANGREDVLARVIFVSRKSAEGALWGDREYGPFLQSGVWSWDEQFLGRAAEFKGIGRNVLPPRPSPTKGFVASLGE